MVPWLNSLQMCRGKFGRRCPALGVQRLITQYQLHKSWQKSGLIEALIKYEILMNGLRGF